MTDPRKVSYDAVVIGAGMAGLVAAATLARGGARVLVCEQADHVGGLFNSFDRNGYVFDGGIKATESSALLLPLLGKLGVLDRVQLHPSRTALITDGELRPIRDFADVEAHFAHLASLFPAEASGLRSVLADTRRVFDVLDAGLTFPVPLDPDAGSGREERKAWMKAHSGLLAAMPGLLPLMKRKLRPHLERSLKDPRLINLLADLFPDGTTAFFGLGYFRMFLDYYYPQGGLRTIPEALASVVTEWGGEIRTGSRVERILVRDGRAGGVRLDDAEEVASAYVIAASDLRHTLTTLIPDARMPARIIDDLLHAEVSHSVFSVFLGLDMPPEALGFEGCGHVFYSPDLEGVTDVDRRSRPDYFRCAPMELSVPCLHDASLAPPGKTGLSVAVMTTWEYNGGWPRTRVEYEAAKSRYARDIIIGLDRLRPGLSQTIEFCETATPRTIEKFTSNTRGAIMGWSYDRDRRFSHGSYLRMRSSVRTPVEGLLTAGHWTLSPGGAPTAAITGMLAGEHVLKSG